MGFEGCPNPAIGQFHIPWSVASSIMDSMNDFTKFIEMLKVDSWKAGLWAPIRGLECDEELSKVLSGDLKAQEFIRQVTTVDSVTVRKKKVMKTSTPKLTLNIWK